MLESRDTAQIRQISFEEAMIQIILVIYGESGYPGTTFLCMHQID